MSKCGVPPRVWKLLRFKKPKRDWWRLGFLMNWIFRSGIWWPRCGKFYDLPICDLQLENGFVELQVADISVLFDTDLAIPLPVWFILFCWEGCSYMPHTYTHTQTKRKENNINPGYTANEHTYVVMTLNDPIMTLFIAMMQSSQLLQEFVYQSWW